MPFLRCLACALLLVFLGAAAPAAGAETRASLAGTVRDAESGEPIAEAMVTLSSLGRVALTDAQGRYVLEAPPGPQHVTVRRLGYAFQEFDALLPERGTLEINVALRCKPIPLPPIEVRGRVPVRGLERSGAVYPDRSISQDAVYQHPLLAEPDFLRAIGGGEVVLEPESPSGIHVRGGASDQVAYLLDGIPVFNPYHTAGTFGAWNPDALSGAALFGSALVPSAPDALSGVVSANTRTPEDALHTRGSLSATQARAAVDGPLGHAGAGYLVSVSSAFPGLVVPRQEASHLHGDNFDWLAKVESPLFGGRVRLLGCASQSEIDVAAAAESADVTRHRFLWDSRSVGAEWSRPLGRAALVLRGWRARGTVDATWAPPDSSRTLASRRRDDGVVTMIALPVAGGRTAAGARLQRGETAYRSAAATGEAFAMAAETPVSTIFLSHERAVGARGGVDVSLSNAFVRRASYLSASARVSWRPVAALSLSATAARRHQFGQSLRNPEAVAANVFPADIFVGAGDGGVPVARSDIGIVALEHRPNGWLRVGGQAWVRNFAGLALVAPRGAGPFAIDGYLPGTGRANGFALEAGASGGRYGLLASYGYQRVRLAYDGGGYVPGYGAVHSIEAGIVALPAPTVTIQLGYASVLGRRDTATLGTLEWESSNLLDGSEFAGSPSAWSGALGGTGLPAYHRLDLGVRKRWPVKFAGRDGVVSAFGTVTNLLGRSNVLTFAVDPSTGSRNVLEMRPLSPLVVGIDWRF